MDHINPVTSEHTDMAIELLDGNMCLVTIDRVLAGDLRDDFSMANWSNCLYGTAFKIANGDIENPDNGPHAWVSETLRDATIARLFTFGDADDRQVVRLYR